MKAKHIFSLFFLASAITLAATPNDLGNVMYIGDSITHGYNSSGHRWEMHKIITDNGLTYKEIGVMVGNDSNRKTSSVPPGISYSGKVFANEHCAQSSGRASEVSGSKLERNGGSRYKGSNINNWLGLSDIDNNKKPYTGPIFKDESAPDIYVITLGTNDLLSDHGDADFEKNPKIAKLAVANLLDDIQSIYNSIRKATPKAQIYITSVPVFAEGHKGIDSPESHQVVYNFNKAIAKWCKRGNIKAKFIDLSPGMKDVSEEKPCQGVQDIFGDPVHPATQGSRLMATNIAQAQGLAGRTAGLTRKSGRDFETVIKGYKKAAKSNPSALAALTSKATPSEELSAELLLRLGNGAKGGWDKENELQITLSNGKLAGSLKLSEPYIKWGDRVIYSTDMSKLSEPLRICYYKGDTSKNIQAGFYVWLGEKMIGEALESSPSNEQGLILTPTDKTKSSKPQAQIKLISLDRSGAYAPAIKQSKAKQ